MKHISVLILAAGSASRMGSVKQLLPYKDSTILQTVIKNILALKVNKVYCVLGANFEAIKNKIQTKEVQFIINHNWKEGLSSSIVTGVKHFQSSKNQTNAILVLLADQPNVDSNYINELIKLHINNEDKIIASTYGNKKGVPAIFPLNTFDDLLKLKGDKGARTYLNNENENVIKFTPKSSEILSDIDTPEDYKKFITNKNFE